MSPATAGPAPGMPLRGDRIHRYVNAFCPRCHDESLTSSLADVRRLSGTLTERNGTIWLERGCPEHGLISTMYDQGPQILSYLEEWTAPTKRHTPDTAGNFDPIPQGYLAGLTEMQTQHTCIRTCPGCWRR